MIAAAALAAVNVPFSKLLMGQLPVLLLAGLTYLGGALFMGVEFLIARLSKKDKDPLLSGKDWLYVVSINILDTIANAMLFYGISLLNGETASLLQSFEVVSTAIFAFTIFKEKVSWRLWIAIGFIVAASAFLSFSPGSSFSFQPAVFLILGTTLCWGFTDNLCKRISHKDPREFTTIKCLVPGTILTLIALAFGQHSTDWGSIGLALLDGAFSYGLSICLMVFAFRKLSASLGTTLYASNPFLGAIYSLIVFRTIPEWNFYVAVVLLILGSVLASIDGFLIEKKEREALLKPS